MLSDRVCFSEDVQIRRLSQEVARVGADEEPDGEQRIGREGHDSKKDNAEPCT